MRLGFFVYLRFQFGLSPLERYYLPYYLRSETAGLTHPASTYQMLYVSDGQKAGRPALDADVQPGSTPQFGGKPLPLTLTPQAASMAHIISCGSRRASYQNKAIHAWIAHWIYGDVPLYRLFTDAVDFWRDCIRIAAPVFNPQRHRAHQSNSAMAGGSRARVLVNAKAFNQAVGGAGIGITTNDAKLPLRIPRDAENKHFLIVGDTGTGKSSIIRQMLYQVDARGDSAIVYDPACEFVKQFLQPASRRHCA